MLKKVSQLGQGALSLSEEKPETTIFVGKKKDILHVVFVKSVICCFSIGHRHKL